MAEKLGFDILLKGNNLTRLFAGMGVALRISVISVVISLGLGLVLGTFLSMKKPVLNAVFSVYLNIVRFMPQLVLLFIVYFGATKAMSINLEAEPAAVIVFSFWGIAEMADLVRAALISIPVGQYESSMALGLNTLQTYVYVIIPQAIRRLIPQSINLVTRMIKTTSLVMMIGIVEVLKVGQQIIEAGRKTSPNAAFGVFATVFLMYFLVCWPISLISKKLEKKWENGYG
ncbi:MAG: amino acid ABC transporter permease [Lachnospiraceae bacterium]|nr:amino acid ABC transporter permease [Lachnospiraceae bacterium]